MFISRKRLERIIEEERLKERERLWQEQDRQREREEINKRFEALETRIWQLIEKIEKKNRNRKLDN